MSADLPITSSDMADFMRRATSSGNIRILSAISYYHDVKADIEAAIAKDPSIVIRLAENALDAAILGMRRAIPGRAITIRKEGFWNHLLRKFGKDDQVHPLFHNEAFGIFLSCLFDSIHNLPALMMPPGACMCTFPDPAKEIAWALACLRLMPVTQVAVDLRFEPIFLALAPEQSPKS